jgi:peptidoglycan-N-acetylglucosamine deacetylase
VFRVAQRIYRANGSADGISHACLTFDDGPDPVFTPQVLDLLAASEVRATFFLVGEKALAEPDLVARIRDAGHAIGSHSVSHPDPSTLGLRELIREYAGGRAMVEDACGRPVRLFRPPMGRWGVRHALAARRARVEPWIWSVDPQDWRPDPDADALAGFVLERIGPGHVVLLHDGIASPADERCHDRSATIRLLQRVLPEIQARGLPMGPLPERGAARLVDAA